MSERRDSSKALIIVPPPDELVGAVAQFGTARCGAARAGFGLPVTIHTPAPGTFRTTRIPHLSELTYVLLLHMLTAYVVRPRAAQGQRRDLDPGAARRARPTRLRNRQAD